MHVDAHLPGLAGKGHGAAALGVPPEAAAIAGGYGGGTGHAGTQGTRPGGGEPGPSPVRPVRCQVPGKGRHAEIIIQQARGQAGLPERVADAAPGGVMAGEGHLAVSHGFLQRGPSVSLGFSHGASASAWLLLAVNFPGESVLEETHPPQAGRGRAAAGGHRGDSPLLPRHQVKDDGENQFRAESLGAAGRTDGTLWP